MLPLSAGPRVLKQTARKLVSPVQLHHKSCVSLVDIVSSADSLHSSRNSVQALFESRHCIPSTQFNTMCPCCIASSGQGVPKTPLICQIPVNRSYLALCRKVSVRRHMGQIRYCLLLCHSWLGFAHLLDLRIGQHFTTLWNTWQAPPSSKISYRRSKGRSNLLSGYAMRIGE
jgi:hypothetical protein